MNLKEYDAFNYCSVDKTLHCFLYTLLHMQLFKFLFLLSGKFDNVKESTEVADHVSENWLWRVLTADSQVYININLWTIQLYNLKK